MANWKKVDADQLDADLTAVADAIRAMSAKEDTVAFPDGYVKELGDILGKITGFIDRSLTDIRIPSGTNKIGTGAFMDCYDLQKAHLSDSVDEIDKNAFAHCESLASLIVRKSNGVCNLTNMNALLSTPIGSDQSLVIQTPNGLPGVPVSSNETYTDEAGQKWVCDTVDFERGVYVQRVYRLVLTSGTPLTYYNSRFEMQLPNNNFPQSADGYWQPWAISTHYKTATQGNIGTTQNAVCTNNVILYITDTSFTSLEDYKAFLDEQQAAGTPVTVLYAMATPIETPLDAETLAAYAALQTYSPSTNTANDAGAYMELGYTNAAGTVNTVSGTSFSISDSGNAPLNSLVLYGKTTQDGTPSPDTPAALVSTGRDGNISIYISGSNMATGYVYVPSALVDSYKTATNWSLFADKIRAIEDYPDITGG